MQIARTALSAVLAVSLAACGGSNSGSSGSGGGGATPTPSPTPAPSSATCSLRDRQDWALSVLQDTYLYPNLIDSGINPDSFATVQDYIDALLAPARAQGRDRFFTYITSIEEENALIESGASAGFGIRLSYDTSARRLFVLEAFESAPAFAAGIDRGTEIVGIGTSQANIEDVSAIFARGGAFAVSQALGPSDPGVSRVLRISDGAGTRTVTVRKQDFQLDPISDRYGVVILNDGGKRVGYLNFRTFFPQNADAQLRAAFAEFKSAGVDELVVDFRYNGGGLLYLATVLSDLLGEGLAGQTQLRVAYNPSRSSENVTVEFQDEPNAIRPERIAFITSEATASASEAVIASLLPYYDDGDIALIGSDTAGKAIGQEAYDREECDDRLRVIAFQLENADGQGDYFNGIGSIVPVTCRAADDISEQLGDEDEASIAKALDYLAGRGTCTPVAGGQGASALQSGRQTLRPDRNERSAAQYEIPGLF